METFHLLIADQDAATSDEWPHYEHAIAQSRERFTSRSTARLDA